MCVFRLIAAVALAVAVSGCARMETAHFDARAGQQALVRDGQPAIVSRLKNSIVIVRPASRQFQAGKRPVYVVAMYNLTNAALQFAVANVGVTQTVEGQAVALRVYTYDELVTEEKRRQAFQAVATGLAVAGNSMQAANAGYYHGTANVYGPNGAATVNVSGYDPTAAAIAQNRAAVQNDAMIANTVATGQQNMDMLERSVIKDNTLLPGEWYGGQLQFDPPAGKDGKRYVITIPVGNDVHQIEVTQEAIAS
jgi:hypothetical protein